MISGANYREGVALSPDGAVYVQLASGSTVDSPTFTGVSKFADGAVGAPSIALTSEPTTGLFRVGPSTLSITVSGAEIFRAIGSGAFSLGGLWSSSPSGGIGYITGAGGTISQATSKSTGVTLSKTVGQITMNNAALASGAKVSFVVTNTAVGANDIPVVAISSGGTANAYRANVTAVAAGSFTVTVENITGGSLSESPVVSFALMKGAVA